MTAPTDAPVEERHRRAACLAHSLNRCVPDFAEAWVATGQWSTANDIWFEAEATAKVAANAERDGRASRDAEVAELRGIKPELPPYPPDGNGLPRYGLRWNGPSEPLAVPMAGGYWTPFHLASAEVAELSAYRRAWERWLELSAPFARNAGERILAEELARKGTP